MDRMLVVVFKEESQAYEGKTALQNLNQSGDIALYAYAVIRKNADGTSSVKQGDDRGPLGTLVGTSVGALVGLLAGPAGVVVGASAGLLAGMTDDLNNSRVGADFIQDVSARLTPGKVALIAEINEDWTTPVDTKMEALGGEVFRRALKDVSKQVDDEDVASLKADIDQTKAERINAQADRKQKLQHKIDALEAKLQASLARSKQKREQQEQIARAKGAVLEARAAALATRS